MRQINTRQEIGKISWSTEQICVEWCRSLKGEGAIQRMQKMFEGCAFSREIPEIP